MNDSVQSISNNNQIGINNDTEHVEPVVMHTQHPNGSEFESSSTVESSTPSSANAKNNENEVRDSSSSKPKIQSSGLELSSSGNDFNIDFSEINNAIATSDKAIHTFNNSPITGVRSTNPTPPVNNKNRLLTKAKAEMTTAVKERAENEQINLTENFVKKNALTAQLKNPVILKKARLGSLINRLKKNGQNLSRPRSSAVELEAEPVSAPMTNSLNALMAAPKKFRSKNTSLTPKQPDIKLTRIRGSIQDTIYKIEEHLRHMNINGKPLQTEKRNILNDSIDKLNAFFSELEGYRRTNPTFHNDEQINDIIARSSATIKRVNDIIYSRGGKRRTHKKRKQKKQKKRFGTQKK